MMQEHVSLRHHQSFRIDVRARWFVDVSTPEQVQQLRSLPQWQHARMVLGGGTNLLFVDDFPGLVVRCGFRGLEQMEESANHVVLRVGAAEPWHDLVAYCVDHGYFGLENLALIPGTVGAAPIQNIGAYGAEFSEVCQQVECIDLDSGEGFVLTKDQCAFSYRDSIFKSAWKNRALITAVWLRLTKTFVPNIRYADLKKYFYDTPLHQLTAKAVFDAVVAIRRAKLPDPSQLGNAGSFFKNPVVSRHQYELLKQVYPQLPHYPDGSTVKIPAAWLIEQCGWKGYRRGPVGVHERQPLVLVNFGGATGRQLLQLAIDVHRSVADRFGITLEPEVQIVGGELNAFGTNQ